MAHHPINLALRFLLEIAAISALVFWGWAWGGWIRWPAAVAIAVAAMAVWGIFRTPGERYGGDGYVATPGPVRLAVELVFFALAVFALLNAHANARATWFALILAAAVTIHYVLSWDRIRWLLAH